MKTKFLYIVHLSGKRVNRLWLSALRAAENCGFSVHLACNMDEIIPDKWAEDCEKYHIIAHHIDFDRRPWALKNIKACWQLRHLMQQEKFDIVHCNTPVGGVLGRICAHKVRIPYVIYQAHGFHFYKGAPLKNWLLYYPVEKLLSYWTDVLITINQEDYALAQKKMKAKQIEYLPGVGIDLERFRLTTYAADQKSHKRKELGIPQDAVVFLSVGELIPRKDHITALRAFAKAGIANARYLICGSGPEAKNLKAAARECGIEEQVLLLGFRSDIDELLCLADIFCFPSLQEGLPVALMEAMAAGLPCMASRVRGNVDLLGESYPYLFDAKDVPTLSRQMRSILNEKQACAEQSLQRIRAFDFTSVQQQMTRIYSDMQGQGSRS